MDNPTEKGIWFEREILPHKATLRHRVRRILPAGYDLEDIVDETLTRAYQANNWQEVRSGLALLTRIAYNLLIDQQRRETIVSLDFVADLDELQRSVSYDGMLVARDHLRRVEAAIQTLPDRMREIFVLKRVYGYSLQEIAEKMGLSVSSIEKYLTQALSTITRCLDRDEEDAVETRRQNRESTRSHSTGSGALGGSS